MSSAPYLADRGRLRADSDPAPAPSLSILVDIVFSILDAAMQAPECSPLIRGRLQNLRTQLEGLKVDIARVERENADMRATLDEFANPFRAGIVPLSLDQVAERESRAD